MWVCNSSHNGKLLLQIFPLKHFQEQFLFRIKKRFGVRSARQLFQTLEMSIPGIHWTVGPLQDTELESRPSRVNLALELPLKEKPNTVNWWRSHVSTGNSKGHGTDTHMADGDHVSNEICCFNTLSLSTPNSRSLWIMTARPYQGHSRSLFPKTSPASRLRSKLSS